MLYLHGKYLYPDGHSSFCPFFPACRFGLKLKTRTFQPTFKYPDLNLLLTASRLTVLYLQSSNVSYPKIKVKNTYSRFILRLASPYLCPDWTPDTSSRPMRRRSLAYLPALRPCRLRTKSYPPCGLSVRTAGSYIKTPNAHWNVWGLKVYALRLRV